MLKKLFKTWDKKLNNKMKLKLREMLGHNF